MYYELVEKMKKTKMSVKKFNKDELDNIKKGLSTIIHKDDSFSDKCELVLRHIISKVKDDLFKQGYVISRVKHYSANEIFKCSMNNSHIVTKDDLYGNIYFYNRKLHSGLTIKICKCCIENEYEKMGRPQVINDDTLETFLPLFTITEEEMDFYDSEGDLNEF